MLPHRTYGPNDLVHRLDGDSFFVGVDERLSPHQLPPGYLAGATNARFRNGKLATRGAALILPWLYGTGRTPFVDVYCATVFSDPATGEEWILIAADNGVFKTRPNNVATAVPLGDVVLTADTAVKFTQNMNAVFLHRGADEDMLVCSDLTTGFTPVPTGTLDADYTRGMPRSSFGIFYLNRFLVIEEGAIGGVSDQVAVSDALDYTRWFKETNTFRVNEGNNDAMVAMQPLGRDSLLMLKDQSVLRVDGLTGGPSGAVLYNVTGRNGCVASRSVVASGADAYWLSESGVVSLRLTETNEIQATHTALSDSIPRTMGRINRRYRHRAAGIIWNGRYYLSVPLDDARVYGPDLVAGGDWSADSSTVLADSGADLAGEQPPSYGPEYDYEVEAVVGATYFWEQGDADERLANDTNDLATGTTFVAEASTLLLFTQSAVTKNVTGRLRRVLREGVNNAVLVYDFVNQAWSGVDEGRAICVREWLVVTINDTRRLCALCEDGVLRLYDDEGGFDEVLEEETTPYATVLQFTPDGAGVDISVGGGSTYTTTDDDADMWAAYRTTDDDGAPVTPTATAPNCLPERITNGVRFLSLNGDPVPVSVDGSAINDSAFPVGGIYVELIQYTQIARLHVPLMALTRGYQAQDGGRQSFRQVETRLRTWSPRYKLEVRADGAGDWEPLMRDNDPLTRSRTKYLTNRPAWVSTNVNDDHGTAGREDYSVVLDSDGVNLGFDGVELQRFAYWTDGRPVQSEGNWVQYRLTNDRGQLELVSLQCAALDGQRRQGQHP